MSLAPHTPTAARQQADTAEQVQEPFGDWLAGLVSEARTRGYEDRLIERTLAGLEPLQRVIRNDRSQAELTLTFERYYGSRVTPALVRQGRGLADRHRALLRNIEDEYKVQGRVLLAIWAVESRFGANTGRTPVFRALATLAWEPRRSAFFRSQLFDALTIAAAGDIPPATMTGSWAGAMGQTQFMPSSYLAYAVDFDDDGRRDIWKSTPDALASIANYLASHGWEGGRIWGREVRVSAAAARRIEERVGGRTSGCYAMRDMTARIPLSEWQELGVRREDGSDLPEADLEAGLVTAGSRRFLVYSNYDALLRYNCSHHYALSVGLLSDALE